MRARIVLLTGMLGACVDADGDGYAAWRDCDDTNPAIHPGATEVCNGVDDNCNGQVDEGVSVRAWRDRDGDGYGDPAAERRVCTMPEDGADNPDDCDDTNPEISPETRWFRDEDGDGFGDPGEGIQQCEAPPGRVRNERDCDDAAPWAWTDRAEICDGLDNNCDGQIDEGLPLRWLFLDADGDGHGDPNARVRACGPLPGIVELGDDCDDTNPNISPSATEQRGTGVDEDCDGYVDELEVPTHAPDVATAFAQAGGAVVQLAPGLWLDALDLRGLSGTLAGSGPDRTLVYVSGGGPAIRTDGVTVENLEVRGARGGAIRVEGSATLRRVWLTDNQAERGGGVDVVAGELRLEDARLWGNRARLDGGGLHVGPGAEARLERVDLRANRADRTGGAIALRSGRLEGHALVIAANEAWFNGGGVASLREGAPSPPDEGDDPFAPELRLSHVTFAANVPRGDLALGRDTGSEGASLFASAGSVHLDHALLAHHPWPRQTILFTNAAVQVSMGWMGSHANGEMAWQWGPLEDARRGDPDFVSFEASADPRTWDLRFLPGSAFVDVGDPLVFDTDGTRSDLGGYAGPFAADDAADGLHRDDDGDGLPDPWERAVGLLPWLDDAAEDPDGDGLDNAGELAWRTDPFDPDSDGDGVGDGAEVLAGTDPTWAGDRAPRALILPVRSAPIGQAVALDGGLSFDADGDALSWQWRVLPPPGGGAQAAASASPNTTLTPDAPGLWRVRLTVTDGFSEDAMELSLWADAAVVVPDDAPTVGEALALAPFGGMVAVRPGAWPVGAAIAGEVHLLGLGGPGEVVLTGDGGRLLTVGAGASLRLEGLTLEGGTATEGGGVGCFGTQEDPAALWMREVTLQDHVATDGGALYARDCEVWLDDVRVWHNLASRYGGGLRLERSPTTILRSVVAHNQAQRGGGIELWSRGAPLRVAASSLHGNHASTGAAVWLSASSSRLAFARFEHVAFADHDGPEVIFLNAGRLLLTEPLFAYATSVLVDATEGEARVLQPGVWQASGGWSPQAALVSGAVSADPEPLFRAQGGSAEDVWTLRPGSGLRRAGRHDRVDHDEGRTGIGMGHGLDAARWWLLDGLDLDGDGMSDGWELRFGLDPTTDDADGDLDGDGVSNLDEYLAGTRPDVPGP